MVFDVTVVVCTRDRPFQLEACLSALAEQRYPRFDILVVNNGTTEAAADICRQRGVACIREPVPGLTRARNLGARAAGGAIVAYIDDDARAEPEWLSALAREFEDPRVAAVAGRTRYMKSFGDTLQMSDDEAPDEPGPRPHRIFDRSTRNWFTLACFGGIGDGNTMAFRRDLLTKSVRFDERLGRGRLLESGDEHVAFMSLISDGYRVSYAPDAVVCHPIPADPVQRRAKRVRDLRASVAYMMFLWLQFPGHRADITRFLGEALRRRVSGSAGAAPALSGVSRYQALAAVLGGVLVYRQARQEWIPQVRRADRTADAAKPRVVTLQ